MLLFDPVVVASVARTVTFTISLPVFLLPWCPCCFYQVEWLLMLDVAFCLCLFVFLLRQVFVNKEYNRQLILVFPFAVFLSRPLFCVPFVVFSGTWGDGATRCNRHRRKSGAI